MPIKGTYYNATLGAAPTTSGQLGFVTGTIGSNISLAPNVATDICNSGSLQPGTYIVIGNGQIANGLAGGQIFLWLNTISANYTNNLALVQYSDTSITYYAMTTSYVFSFTTSTTIYLTMSSNGVGSNATIKGSLQCIRIS
jgi:hypothetical protein